MSVNGEFENKDVLYRREDHYCEDVTEDVSKRISAIITDLGEDVTREGLLKTPERVAKAYQFLTHGYHLDPDEILQKALFDEAYSEMIVVKDIEVYSLCEHHMLPFFGKAHVAYIPNGKIVGLSKIPTGSGCFCSSFAGSGTLDHTNSRCD